MKDKFLYGMDISSLLSLETQGAKFYDETGSKQDLLVILKDSGVESIRLRLWVDPTSPDGITYGGGGNDLNTTLILAKRAYNLGFSIVLDFHFSDFWADPAKQFMPKDWENLSFNELVSTVEKYTEMVIDEFNKLKIKLAYIQVGNEIPNGMLWPHGQLYDKGGNLISGGHKRLSHLINAGISAIRKASPESKIIIHLDRGGDVKMYEDYFKVMHPLLSKFDIIGLSYYPYWHGTLTDLGTTIDFLKQNYQEEVMIMETSYGFDSEARHGPFVVTAAKTPRIDTFPPYTVAGQAEYLAMLFKFILSHKVDGLFYWEPAWIPIKGDTWATKEGIKYIKEDHKEEGNEWANQALFDYTGHPLPALYVYKNYLKGEKR